MPTPEPILASEILSGERLDPGRGLERLRAAVVYSLGLGWSGMVGREPLSARIAHGLPRYLDLLSGSALLAGPPPPPTPFELEVGVGTSLGTTGLVLAVLGAIRRWRSRWPLLGLGLFAGNAAFYFWYQTQEALSYTVPGLAGLAFLAGLGMAGAPGEASGRERRVLEAIGALTAAILLVGNYRAVDRSAALEPLGRPHLGPAEAALLPRRSVLLLDHWHATTYRYLLHIEAGRTDVEVLGTDLNEVAQWDRIVASLGERGRPTFVFAAPELGLDPRVVSAHRARTPAALARHGFVLAYDPSRDAPRSRRAPGPG
jgi:hypothetical protein